MSDQEDLTKGANTSTGGVQQKAGDKPAQKKEFISPMKQKVAEPASKPTTKRQGATILSQRGGAEKPKPGVGGAFLTQADLNLFAMLGEVEPDSQSQVQSQSGELHDIRRPDAIASEGPDSTAMAGGIEFGNDNLSQNVFKNDYDSLQGDLNTNKRQKRTKKQSQYMNDFICEYPNHGQNANKDASHKDSQTKNLDKSNTSQVGSKQAKKKVTKKTTGELKSSNSESRKMAVADQTDGLETNMAYPANLNMVPVYFDPNILYCTCQQPETAEMVGCDTCEQWYHCSCVGIDMRELLAAEFQKIEYPFECEECQNKKNPKLAKSKAGTTTAKPATTQSKGKADEGIKKGKQQRAPGAADQQTVSGSQIKKGASSTLKNISGKQTELKKVKTFSQMEMPEDVDLTSKETLCLKKRGKSATYPPPSPEHIQSAQNSQLIYQNSEIPGQSFRKPDAMMNREQLDPADGNDNGQDELEALQSYHKAGGSMQSGVARGPAESAAHDSDNFEIKINPLAVKTIGSSEIRTDRFSARTPLNGNVMKSGVSGNLSQLNQMKGALINKSKLKDDLPSFNGNGRHRFSPTRYQHGDEKSDSIYQKEASELSYQHQLSQGNTLVGSKRKFNIDAGDILQPIAKRSKIIYSEDPNDSKAAPIPHIGIYSDHQLVYKLKLEQKQASVPRKTELHELPTLLKLMSQPSTSNLGESGKQPTSTKQLLEMLSSRFRQVTHNKIPSVYQQE